MHRAKSSYKFFLSIFFAANVFVYIFLTVNLGRGYYPFLVASETIKKGVKKVSENLSQQVLAKEEGIIDSPKGNHFPWGQCTWYVATKRNVPWNGNAIDWYRNAQNYGRKVGGIPKKGSIVVLRGGYYGHVGYVESASGIHFTFSESNNPIPGKITTKSMLTSDPKIVGFIY